MPQTTTALITLESGYCRRYSASRRTSSSWVYQSHRWLGCNFEKRTSSSWYSSLGLGGFVCTTSIIEPTTIAASSSWTDATWSQLKPTPVWIVEECDASIICACTPMIRQLSVLFPWTFVPLARESSHAPISTQGTRQHCAAHDIPANPHLSQAPVRQGVSEEQLHPRRNIF
ncbi:hypothetical protein MGYG_04289 [Nannizzia gypsea CBS 118893]|uniref:Rhodopsin domain-containing protein n=1 Tax=Arthroderma gypseum (strain ATCC MYA-4604 / CBS 118893) TaxID=535722 RepID=E4US80_ARTGP|nr:hypothetical protein MGYG_04289 [Nannizzia gypsea CBS 118893]EFR01284.1 hypothetical protein MGYG_04289 [Nannizzia gypsea CBS 118893]